MGPLSRVRALQVERRAVRGVIGFGPSREAEIREHNILARAFTPTMMKMRKTTKTTMMMMMMMMMKSGCWHMSQLQPLCPFLPSLSLHPSFCTSLSLPPRPPLPRSLPPPPPTPSSLPPPTLPSFCPLPKPIKRASEWGAGEGRGWRSSEGGLRRQASSGFLHGALLSSRSCNG